jgi:hypothetical protein
VSKNISKKLHFSVFVPNRSIEVQPLAAAATKDSHGPSNTSPARQQPPLRSDVKVFIGDPPSFLFSIPEWEAQDRIRRHEARDINTGKRRRAASRFQADGADYYAIFVEPLTSLSSSKMSRTRAHWLISGGSFGTTYLSLLQLRRRATVRLAFVIR